ncbi:condensation domain-containing protein [Streptomyces sp. NPDC096012]|uniref:condensation domain-containing protein n=1 Tax=Streptomyces sp. NPDC096012 TaxID=3155684 RepID=UPI003369EFC1
MARSGRWRRVRIRNDRRTAVPDRADRPSVPVPRQRCDALLDSAADRFTARHVEQIWWRWHGPLDTERFVSAWQSVAEREAVLRAAFERRPSPRIVFHPHAHTQVLRHLAGSVDWDELLQEDRLHGFDVSRPGLLRVTLVDTGVPDGTRVLLTFHHGLLDARSAYVLVNEFSRAYLADGVLPGGERRPDIRDWMCWLQRQDTASARDFLSRVLPAGTPVVLPVPAGPRTRRQGRGRAEARLTTAEANRLHRWAATRGLPDSSMVHVVWALLLYRAAKATGPVPVCFGVTASGRGITLESAERLVGPLRARLPVTVLVDPSWPIGRLLAALRDRVLEMAAYEWVSTGQIREWAGRPDSSPQSFVSLEHTPCWPADLRAQLAEQGIRFGRQHAGGAHPAEPLALLVRGDADGSRSLAVVHDRSRIADADASRLADQCVRLLRHLPTLDGTETVAEVLDAAAPEEPPHASPPRPGPGH